MNARIILFITVFVLSIIQVTAQDHPLDMNNILEKGAEYDLIEGMTGDWLVEQTILGH